MYYKEMWDTHQALTRFNLFLLIINRIGSPTICFVSVQLSWTKSLLWSGNLTGGSSRTRAENGNDRGLSFACSVGEHINNRPLWTLVFDNEGRSPDLCLCCVLYIRNISQHHLQGQDSIEFHKILCRSFEVDKVYYFGPNGF